VRVIVFEPVVIVILLLLLLLLLLTRCILLFHGLSNQTTVYILVSLLVAFRFDFAALLVRWARVFCCCYRNGKKCE
jgi:hypothetical protein